MAEVYLRKPLRAWLAADRRKGYTNDRRDLMNLAGAPVTLAWHRKQTNDYIVINHDRLFDHRETLSNR